MENVRNLIASANQNFMDAFKRADAAGLAALYTDDTRLLPPGFPMMSGREAVQSFWQSAMDTGIKAARLETVEVESEGNLASEIGRFVLTVQPHGGESTEMTGKYLVVWKKQDGAWKLHIDIWNTDAA
ncbi:MAG: hypothetical protein JWN60_513 [Acidobacteria bacterium]|nr:hypothetical protein [Acidobacteriota bacterium]